MPAKPAFSRHIACLSGWAVRAAVALALFLGIVAVGSNAGSAPVSAQAPGAINVNISASPNPAAVGQQVSFSFSASEQAVTPPQPTITSLTLNYGDGSVVSLPPGATQETHTYSAANTYTVTLTATDSTGASNSGSTSVTVEQLAAPVVQIAPATQTALVGQQVTFQYSVSSSSIIGGFAQAPAITVSFGDGSVQQLQAASGTVMHTYSSAGAYTVTISAGFPGGQPGSGSALVSVGSATPPAVTLSASPTSVAPGQPVNFSYTITPSSASAIIRSATLNFGDGSSAVLQNASGTVSHTYTTQNTYTAILGATDINGQSGQASATVTVAPPAVSGQQLSGVAFVNPPASGTSGQPVSFTVGTATTPNSGASISSYSINFGDNTAAVTATPGQALTHIYSAPGTYTVTLTVTDSTGVSTSTTSQIVIAAVGMPVQYAAGWNLVSGPTGTVVTGNVGPLYSFPPGATTYQVIQNGTPLNAGQGYWAYFPTAATSSIAFVTAQTPRTASVQAPAGQFFQIGNPGNTVATISGADAVDAFDPATNSYVQTTTLQPGQAAWVYSAAGGTITITNAAQ
jgi:PKD repeat protein